MDELKPCPFCGQPPTIEDTDEATHIFCETDDCLGPSITMHAHVHAVAMWNRRATAGVQENGNG
jgi:Lar family restriction alleviation protein